MGEVKKSVKGSRSAAGRTVRAVRRSLDRQEARYKRRHKTARTGAKATRQEQRPRPKKGQLKLNPEFEKAVAEMERAGGWHGQSTDRT